MGMARKIVVVLMLLGLAGSASILAGQSTSLRVIQPVGYKAADAPYSPGILADGTLYISGQGSMNANGSRPAEFSGQVTQALQNVRSVLQAAQMNFGNVVWMNVYLSSRDDIDEMNKVYWRKIGADAPARTVLVVSALPNQERLEICGQRYRPSTQHLARGLASRGSYRSARD